MQVPGAFEFRCQHFRDPLSSQICEDAVVEHTRGVDHATERRLLLAEFAEDGLQLRCRSDVRRSKFHRHATHSKRGQCGFSFCRRRAPSEDRKMTRAVIGQPLNKVAGQGRPLRR